MLYTLNYVNYTSKKKIQEKTNLYTNVYSSTIWNRQKEVTTQISINE